MADDRNSWPNVKYLNLFNVIGQYRHSTATYMGAVIIPSLQMDVPLAAYTSDDVYTLGAGMLVPHSFEESNEFIIGAHNIGYSSTALFTPLTFHRLIGRTVLVTNGKSVKEYTITATKVIMPSQVDIVFKNAPNHLILLTCTDNNKKRLLVKCEFKNEYSIKHLYSKIKKEVKRKYRLHNI
ncbi:sortase [Limosilactobacillus reuteri]|nr:sortase [Limosilactobacillus reuteri]MCH5384503.1 sortase [Limosilactobacillus reuteri]